MKVKATFLLLGAIPLLTSCAYQPLTLAPVGPRPSASTTARTHEGRLQVFSEIEAGDEDFTSYVSDFTRSDYSIYGVDGKLVQHVCNGENPGDEIPAVVTLPAGRYMVKADAERYGQVIVPVVINPGQTTRVVLEPGWKPTGHYAGSDLVRMPDGYPVGWRADLAPKK